MSPSFPACSLEEFLRFLEVELSVEADLEENFKTFLLLVEILEMTLLLSFRSELSGIGSSPGKTGGLLFLLGLAVAMLLLGSVKGDDGEAS